MLGEADGQTGRRALNTCDFLNRFSNRVAQAIEVIGFKLDNHVIWAGDCINDSDASARIGELLDRRADSFRLPDIGFNKDVSTNGHEEPP